MLNTIHCTFLLAATNSALEVNQLIISALYNFCMMILMFVIVCHCCTIMLVIGIVHPHSEDFNDNH